MKIDKKDTTWVTAYESNELSLPPHHRLSEKDPGKRQQIPSRQIPNALGSGRVGEEDDQFVEWETICITLLDWEYYSKLPSGHTCCGNVSVRAVAATHRCLKRMERQRQSDEAVLHRKQSARPAKKREQGSVLARRPSETNENREAQVGETDGVALGL
ncbi:hypothetical protein B0H13DRAFT_1899991 [Mycena leptocephala]|nr:hypothetical protein B0H13DRAFT_1899991 [Mycena leptocephala]